MIFLLATSTREFTGGATWSNGELLAHWWMVKTTRTNSCYACHPNYPKTGGNTAANNISIGFSIFSIFSHETWDILRWCTGRQPNNMWINLIYIFCHSNIAIAISILPSGKHTKHIKKRWKITNAINGKIHYFYGHGFNSELSRWVSRRFPSSQMVTVLTAPMCSSYSWGYIFWVTWATYGHIYHHPEVDQLWHKDLFWHEVDLSSSSLSRILFWHGGEYGIFTHIPRLHSFFCWIEKGFIYKRMTIHLRELLSSLL